MPLDPPQPIIVQKPHTSSNGTCWHLFLTVALQVTRWLANQEMKGQMKKLAGDQYLPSVTIWKWQKKALNNGNTIAALIEHLLWSRHCPSQPLYFSCPIEFSQTPLKIDTIALNFLMRKWGSKRLRYLLRANSQQKAELGDLILVFSDVGTYGLFKVQRPL